MSQDYIKSYILSGFQPIPLYPFSKRPIGLKWNNNWNERAIRILFDLYPKANIGILLGDIVDVEGDTAEANELISSLTLLDPHPTFKSSKSVHHLFLNTIPDLTRINCNNIEFRAHKHQSVVPPSKHPNGSEYVWLSDYSVIPPLPKRLFDLYQQLRLQRTKSNIKRSKKKCYNIKVVCSCCRDSIIIHKNRYTLENQVFLNLKLEWMCHKCRKIDIRQYCRNLKKDKRRAK
jgi:hypothetical protein